MTTREAILQLRSELSGCYDSREIEGMTRIIFEDVLLWQPVDIVMRDGEQLPEFSTAASLASSRASSSMSLYSTSWAKPVFTVTALP